MRKVMRRDIIPAVTRQCADAVLAGGDAFPARAVGFGWSCAFLWQGQRHKRSRTYMCFLLGRGNREQDINSQLSWGVYPGSIGDCRYMLTVLLCLQQTSPSHSFPRHTSILGSWSIHRTILLVPLILNSESQQWYVTPQRQRTANHTHTTQRHG